MFGFSKTVRGLLCSLVFIGLILANACGQKGDLTLPQADTSEKHRIDPNMNEAEDTQQ